MAEGRSRQLAAIMFVDIVGYTALMQEDEDRARRLRDRQRGILSESVPQCHGEILQYYGDGALTVFSSAVQAVECAVEIQKASREDPAVHLRIGVHSGDIVIESGGVYGDGVNVAARIESLAAPGGILISGKVYDEIKNHPSLSAIPFGPARLKNVAHPVSLFGISSHGLPTPDPSTIPAWKDSSSPDGSTAPGEAWDWPGTKAPEPRGLGEAFLSRVKERAVLQWVFVYLLGAWGVLQTESFLAEQLGWPSEIHRGLSIFAFFGLIISVVVAWHHGERGRQPVRPREVGIISAVILVGMIALFALRPDGESLVPDSALGTQRDPRPSVAVLPFDNFSPDPDDAYFANGVQEDVTTALSRIKALRVPARSSVARFRDDRPGSREIARALGADYLLEGSATVVGETVRVAVQLIDGRTDQHVWADEYDYAFSVEQVISVRTSLAQEVAARLEAIITPEEQARISAFPTQVPDALKLYQRARYRWNQRTEAGVRESLRLFQGAIDLDPGYAEAYAGLADAFLVLSNWGWIDHREGHRRGIAAAERALELDPDNASANASLGALHLWSTRNWALSEEHFLRAIALDPDYAYTHYWYSALLSALGRHEESIHQAQMAEEADPLSPQIAYGLPRSLFLARQFDRAVQVATRALEIHPDHGPLYAQICRCRLMMEDFAGAEAACLTEQEVSGEGRTLSMALVRAYQGNREAALREVEGLSEGNPEGGGPQPIFVAMVYAGMGDTEAAFGQLQLAFDEDYPYLEYLPSNPFFDPLRPDPRFEDLLRRIGL